MSEVVLASIGAPSSPVLVKLIEYQGRRFVDIRRYYTAKGSHDLLPTKKGITLGHEALGILLGVLQERQSEIETWCLESEPTAHESHNRAAARDEVLLGPRQAAIEFEDWQSPQFFEVRREGNTDVLVVNRRHPLGKLWTNQGGGVIDGERSLAVALLLAYNRSQALFQHSKEIAASSLLHDLALNWGLSLERYLKD